MALFIIGPYLSDCQKSVLFTLSKVFRIVYCLPFRECDEMEYKEICKQFVDTARQFQPELLQKVKVHLLLHLVDCMLDFGPCSVYNTERCESFNSVLRTYNVFCQPSSTQQRYYLKLCYNGSPAIPMQWWFFKQ